MQVALVPKEALPQVVPLVLPLLSRAITYADGRFSLEDLRQELLEQKQLLWVVFEPERIAFDPLAAFTTTIGEYPGRRVLRIDFLAGNDMAAWLWRAQEVLSTYAQQEGCESLEMTGRLGWLPVLEKLGWNLAFITLEKRLVAHRLERKVG